jgi:hypothetical protein
MVAPTSAKWQPRWRGRDRVLDALIFKARKVPPVIAADKQRIEYVITSNTS